MGFQFVSALGVTMQLSPLFASKEDVMGDYKKYMHVERLGSVECEGLLDNSEALAVMSF